MEHPFRKLPEFGLLPEIEGSLKRSWEVNRSQIRGVEDGLVSPLVKDVEPGLTQPTTRALEKTECL